MLIDPRDKSHRTISKGYLRTAPAAEYLDIGQSTLERARIRGDGPAYRVLGSKIVVYAIEDLDAYAARQVRISTSQAA